jgi:hypothetical protein
VTTVEAGNGPTRRWHAELAWLARTAAGPSGGNTAGGTNLFMSANGDMPRLAALRTS